MLGARATCLMPCSCAESYDCAWILTPSLCLFLQAALQTPDSRDSRRDSASYPMTVSKLRITEGFGGAGDGKNEMPDAFDGGGLVGAAVATPAARRFGLQMSPPNAAAREVCVQCCDCHLGAPEMTITRSTWHLTMLLGCRLLAHF